MRAVLAVAFALVACNSAAELPHTFTAGSPAKASEVNANFKSLDTSVSNLDASVSHLDTRVSDLDTRVLNVESASELLETQATDQGNRLVVAEEGIQSIQSALAESQPGQVVVYTPKQAAIGELIGTINGYDVVLGALPFRDYGSGLSYKITLPMIRHVCPSGCEYYYSSFGNLHFQHVLTNTFSYDMEISGFPARFISLDNYYYHGSDLFQFGFGYNSDGQVISTYKHFGVPALRIAVGETSIFLRVYHWLSNSAQKSVGSSGPDFSLVFTEQELNQPTDPAVWQAITDLFNYISIEPLNP